MTPFDMTGNEEAPRAAPADWREWKRACAIDRCGEETASRLHAFARARFYACMRKAAAHVRNQLSAEGPKSAWHLFETHAQAGSGRGGKRYKDWLFGRAPKGTDEWMRAVEAGATVLLRDAVRAFVRRECRPDPVRSLDAPLGPRARSLTLEDLIPDAHETPAEALLAVDDDAWAKRKAEAFFEGMTPRERIAVWAVRQGLDLNLRELARWSGVRGSTLYRDHLLCMEKLCVDVKKNRPDEKSSVLLTLSVSTLKHLRALVDRKIVLEKGAARFFKRVKAPLDGDDDPS